MFIYRLSYIIFNPYKYVKGSFLEGKLNLRELLAARYSQCIQQQFSVTQKSEVVCHLSQLSYHLRMWYGYFETQSEDEDGYSGI